MIEGLGDLLEDSEQPSLTELRNLLQELLSGHKALPDRAGMLTPRR